MTLLELLIVIALLLGAAALVFPSMLGQLAERSFASTAEQIESHLLLARAEAIAGRRALEVLYDRGSGEITVAPFDPAQAREALESTPAAQSGTWADGDDESINAADLLPLDLEAPGSHDDESGQQAPILSLRLPREHVLMRDRPAPLDASDSPAARAPARDGRDPAEPIRVAIYLADGSALLSRTLWLADAEDSTRLATVEINPWTGLPRIARASPATPEEEADGEGSDAAQDDFALDGEERDSFSTEAGR